MLIAVGAAISSLTDGRRNRVGHENHPVQIVVTLLYVLQHSHRLVQPTGEHVVLRLQFAVLLPQLLLRRRTEDKQQYDECFGKGSIKPSILFTDTLESKIDYLVNKLKIKRFTLYIHPYIAAYVNQGLVSLKRKWQMKYGFGIKIIPDQSLAFLQYRFTDVHGEEIDMKEEIEIK